MADSFPREKVGGQITSGDAALDHLGPQGGPGGRWADGGFAAFGIKELHSAFSKRQDLKRLPLSVFLNLEKKSKS
jgi:hypothetical protein